MFNMRNYKTWIIAGVLGALLNLAGCGTITFFPYESAAKAADKVLDGILTDKDPPVEPAIVSEAKKP